MGLSDKLLLASRSGTVNPQYVAITKLIHDGVGLMNVHGYVAGTEINGYGTLSPMLATFYPSIEIGIIDVSINMATLRLSAAHMAFVAAPVQPDEATVVEFPALKTIVLHSSTGGSPFVINNMQARYAGPDYGYDLFSDELADWAYTNLTVVQDDTYGLALTFTFGLEWA